MVDGGVAIIEITPVPLLSGLFKKRWAVETTSYILKL